MPLLTIEKDEWRNELIAKLDGVKLPFQQTIRIISHVGEHTKVEITCIAGITKNGNDGVIIKESAFEF